MKKVPDCRRGRKQINVCERTKIREPPPCQVISNVMNSSEPRDHWLPRTGGSNPSSPPPPLDPGGDPGSHGSCCKTPTPRDMDHSDTLERPSRLVPSSTLASIWNPALGHPTPSRQARPFYLFCRPPNPLLPCLCSDRWPVQRAPTHLVAISHRRPPSANRQQLARAVPSSHV